MPHLFDSLAINIKTGKVDFVMDKDMTEENAEATVKMAVYRRGVNEHFFSIAPAGDFKEGDKYNK